MRCEGGGRWEGWSVVKEGQGRLVTVFFIAQCSRRLVQHLLMLPW